MTRVLMLQIQKDKLYISNQDLTWSQVAHPCNSETGAETKESNENKTAPITALIIIGSDFDFRSPMHSSPIVTTERTISCGNPLDNSEWDQAIHKGRNQKINFVEDKSLDADGNPKYELFNSGSFALILKKYNSLNDFLASAEDVYEFWLYSRHSNVCIVSSDIVISAAVALGFLFCSRRIWSQNKLELNHILSDVPNIQKAFNTFVPEPNTSKPDPMTMTMRVIAFVVSAFERRYANPNHYNPDQVDHEIVKMRDALRKYQAKKTNEKSGKHSPGYKLQLIDKQISHLQNILDNSQSYPNHVTRLLLIALFAEHNLLRPEAWEERGLLMTGKAGGDFVKVQRRVLQMALGQLDIPRAAVNKRPIKNAKDILESLPPFPSTQPGRPRSDSERSFNEIALEHFENVFNQMKEQGQESVRQNEDAFASTTLENVDLGSDASPLPSVRF